jgi:uncharacterized membrane protein
MRRARYAVLALLLALGAAAPAQAQRTLVIERFDAEITIQADGRVTVVETIRARFTGSWNGIYRTIPVEYRTPQGFNYSLRLDVESVTDDEGQPLRHEGSRERHYRKLKIWVPGAADATRTVVVRYGVPNALRFFEEHDELYWNVTGDEWEVPIEAASARVALPSGVSDVRAGAFTGGYGSQETAADVRIEGQEVTVRTGRALNFREGLTVAVAWAPGVVRRPTAAEKSVGFLRSNLFLGLPLLVLPGMWWLWRTRGRDPRKSPLVVQYEPPDELSPGELGTLVDNSPDMRDVSATLVDLAVRGFVRIEEHEQSKLFGLLSSKDYSFHLRRRPSEFTGLKAHEQRVLNGVFKEFVDRPREDSFGNYATVHLSALQNKFYKELSGIKDALFTQLIDRGWYARRPDTVRMIYLALAIAIGGVTSALGATLAANLGMSVVSAIVAGVLTFAIIFLFGWFMPARTVKGARALDGVLGFEEFLRRVDSDRLERVVKTPEMFERFLPYAMALGVETQWAEAFEDICKQPPQWYAGGTPAAMFRPHAFASDLGRMSAAAGAAMMSAPRSSSGSGFSGGSSGGGFGGGGGGGF